ncbi:MAG: aminopeptidase [Puniceicoccales bacterium]|jgi:aminopeptidase|nr:aminopeptidase [Puniceicoccales bacterium]
MDTRYHQLAELLTGFSTKLQPGENVLIDAIDVPDDIVIALIRAARAHGATPQVNLQHTRINRALLHGSTHAQHTLTAGTELARMKKMHAYIALRGGNNIFENSDIPPATTQANARATRPTLDHRVKKTKWVVLRWPTPAMAQQARMSTEAFEDFYFRVCTLDYARMTPGMAALKAALERTDQVHITGPGTDLRFSVKNIPANPCGGHRNIPDGEVYTAPVRTSIEGTLQYNTPTLYQGIPFNNIRLQFHHGRITNATADTNTERLNAILDTDPGARYIGEFALGFNPHILHPMQDILFDEKIAGSFHLTPGQCYDEANNGNKSTIHWDLVCIQRPEHGGGEIHFDNKLIRKDGLFIPKALQQLNPTHLLKTPVPKSRR